MPMAGVILVLVWGTARRILLVYSIIWIMKLLNSIVLIPTPQDALAQVTDAPLCWLVIVMWR